MTQPLRLAVLISGGGTTLLNLLHEIQEQRLPATVVQVISSRSEARGVQRALDAGLPCEVIRRKDFSTREEFSRSVFDCCRAAKVDLVICGGYLALLQIPADFQQRVMNIHPSLIPAFCGQGFHGLHVHQAVLDRGAKVTGCTVHFLDDHYDHGPIILQEAVPVLDDDTAETLSERVFAAECRVYPEAIRLFATNRLQVAGQRVRILNARQPN